MGPAAKAIWGRAIPEIIPAINNRFIEFYEFTPANILLKYSPEWKISSDSPFEEEIFFLLLQLPLAKF